METPQQRWERTWLYVEEDRKYRGLDNQPDDRKNRMFFPHEDVRDDMISENFEETY